MKLAERIRRARHACHLSQDRLAQIAGVGERTLRNLEHGTHRPQRATLAAVLGALRRVQLERLSRRKARTP